MGFFNKKADKKTGIPELPELPALPEVTTLPFDREFESENSSDYKSLSLPSYPNSSLGERINQSAIKDAVTYGEPEISQKKSKITSPAIQPLPQQKQPRQQRQSQNLEFENQTFEPSMFSKGNSRTVEISDYESPSFSPQTPFSSRMQAQSPGNKIRQTGPLFIQLNKFEDSIAALDEIKIQVSEIESLLRSIQEVKAKEEEKLLYWQRQIESVKARLDKVDRDLFGNV